MRPSAPSGSRVLYCADLAGAGGGNRHRSAVSGGLRNLGWDVDDMDGIAAPLRAVRGWSGAHPDSGRAVPALSRPLSSLALRANSFATARRLSSCSPDVVLWRLGLLQTHALSMSVPVVVELNAPLATEAEAFGSYAWTGWARRLERKVLGRAHAVITVSKELASRLDRPSVVVPNGGGYVDDTEADATRRWGAEHCPICAQPSDTAYAVVLETFRGWHGDAERRAAVSALPDGWTAVVVGDGPARPAFEDWCRSTFARAVFWGRTQAEGVQHLLAEHASLGFVLYPPLGDFWYSPLKLYDFLSHGVPVVGTAVGQVRSVGQREPLVTLVEPGDLDAVRTAVRQADASRRTPTDPLTSPFGWPAAVSAYADVLTAAVRTT